MSSSFLHDTYGSSLDSQKTEYVMTIFHHNEDFKYFIEYYIPQIDYIKEKLLEFNMNDVRLNIYIFTSVDLSSESNINLLFNSIEDKSSYKQVYLGTELHNVLPNSEINLNCKKINCNHIIERILNIYDKDSIPEFNIDILIKTFEIKDLIVNFVNILPYEYDLLKILFPPEKKNNCELVEYFEPIKNQVNWNNNSIGAKRFVSQAFVINLSNNENYVKNEFFHWQSDLYIAIGVPSYAKNYNSINELFVETCKEQYPTVPEIAKFLYQPPEFISRVINQDLGDIIIRNDNSELFTFILAHYQYKNFIDHFTLGQQDISLNPKYIKEEFKGKKKTKSVSIPNKVIPSDCYEIYYDVSGVELTNYQKEKDKDGKRNICGMGNKSTSPYKPKFNVKGILTINAHYDKFYITNIKTIKETRTFYNPLFTDWSEDIFFTWLMQKSNLVIVPFYLLTYSIPEKKTQNFTFKGEPKFEHITFKIFAANFSPTDSSNDKLNIEFKVKEKYEHKCSSIDMDMDMDMDTDTITNSNKILKNYNNIKVSLNYKTSSDIYDKKRGFMLLNIGIFFVKGNTLDKDIISICKYNPILNNLPFEKIEKYKKIDNCNGILFDLIYNNKIYNGMSPDIFDDITVNVNYLVNNNIIGITRESTSSDYKYLTFLYIMNEYLNYHDKEEKLFFLNEIKSMYEWIAIPKIQKTLIRNYDNDLIIHKYMPNIYNSLCVNLGKCNDEMTKYVKDTAPSPFGQPTTSFDKPISLFGQPTTSFEKPTISFDKPISLFGQPTTSFGKPTTSFDKPISPFGKPTTSFDKPISPFGKPISPFGKPISPFGKPISPFEQPIPPPLLFPPIASISSIKIILGLLALANLNNSRTRKAPTPTYISINSEPDIVIKLEFVSVAIAFAK